MDNQNYYSLELTTADDATRAQQAAQIAAIDGVSACEEVASNSRALKGLFLITAFAPLPAATLEASVKQIAPDALLHMELEAA